MWYRKNEHALLLLSGSTIPILHLDPEHKVKQASVLALSTDIFAPPFMTLPLYNHCRNHTPNYNECDNDAVTRIKADFFEHLREPKYQISIPNITYPGTYTETTEYYSSPKRTNKTPSLRHKDDKNANTSSFTPITAHCISDINGGDNLVSDNGNGCPDQGSDIPMRRSFSVWTKRIIMPHVFRDSWAIICILVQAIFRFVSVELTPIDLIDSILQSALQSRNRWWWRWVEGQSVGHIGGISRQRFEGFQLRWECWQRKRLLSRRTWVSWLRMAMGRRSLVHKTWLIRWASIGSRTGWIYLHGLPNGGIASEPKNQSISRTAFTYNFMY